MKKIFAISLLALLMLIPAIVFAQSRGLGGALGNLERAAGNTGLEQDLSSSIATAIKGVLAVLGTIFLILMIYAGVLWMTAGGEESKIEKAQGIIKAAVIGLVITLSAYAITYFVTRRLTEATGLRDTTFPQTCTAVGGVCRSTCGTDEVQDPAVCSDSAQACCIPDLE